MAIHHYQRLRTLLPPEQQVPLLLRLGEVLSYGTTAEAEEIYREALQMSRMTREMFCLMEGRHVHPSTLYPGGVGTVPTVQTPETGS